MGYSKNEVNLMRLIASAPLQQNPAKLVHYVTTLRELLENVTAETTAEGLPGISKAKVNDCSEKIEAIGAKLDVPTSSLSEAGDAIQPLAPVETSQSEEVNSPTGLRRRFGLHRKPEDKEEDAGERDSTTTIKLDVASQAHIEKHRKLQEDLTDEMVDLAQLRESSLMMNQSLQNTEMVSLMIFKLNHYLRFWILRKELWNIAWPAPVMQTSKLWTFSLMVPRQRAGLGF